MSGGQIWGIRAQQAALSGTAVVSIDLELDLDHVRPELQRRLDEVRSQLVRAAGEAQIPATWAVADPMYSAASESILSAGCGHEIAVLGDQAWLGPGCGRDRLARELARRFSAPRKAGIPVSTLVLRNVEQVADLDLLIDHGVKAVAGPAAPSPLQARLTTPALARFGVWQAPPAWQLGPVSTWWSPAAWAWRREIKRVMRTGGTTHLRLSALQLIDSKPHSLETVAALFRYLAERRASGRLVLATMGELAAAALRCRAGTPSRSALRPAA
jgi:hypothetical protein